MPPKKSKAHLQARPFFPQSRDFTARISKNLCEQNTRTQSTNHQFHVPLSSYSNRERERDLKVERGWCYIRLDVLAAALKDYIFPEKRKGRVNAEAG